MRSHDALERHRQVLVATIALQRFALRGDIGSMKRSLQSRDWWDASLRLVRLAWLAGRCWGVVRSAARLVR